MEDQWRTLLVFLTRVAASCVFWYQSILSKHLSPFWLSVCLYDWHQSSASPVKSPLYLVLLHPPGSALVLIPSIDLSLLPLLLFSYLAPLLTLSNLSVVPSLFSLLLSLPLLLPPVSIIIATPLLLSLLSSPSLLYVFLPLFCPFTPFTHPLSLFFLPSHLPLSGVTGRSPWLSHRPPVSVLYTAPFTCHCFFFFWFVYEWRPSESHRRDIHPEIWGVASWNKTPLFCLKCVTM